MATLAAASAAAASPVDSADQPAGHRLMLRVLEAIAQRTPDENPYLGDARARELRAELEALPPGMPLERWRLLYLLGQAELYTGRFAAALARQEEAYALTPEVAL